MGWRYRRSINLGGGFRVNISKSGIGYSWGVKGYRVTKTARGAIRRTFTYPFGFSYVTETKKSKSTKATEQPEIRTYNSEKIENAQEIVSNGLEELVSKASSLVAFDSILFYLGIISFLVAISTPGIVAKALFSFVVILQMIVKFVCPIKLDYEIDEDMKNVIHSNLYPMQAIGSCDSLWRVIEKSNVQNPKYAAGANSLLKRPKCKVINHAVFPFQSNVSAVTFKANGEKLIFMPDKLFVVKHFGVSAINYSDVSIEMSTKNFIEEKRVPKDAKIVDYTWRYVNKRGGPDKRFNNNRRLPVCIYGYIKLTSPSGLNTCIMFSKAELLMDFKDEMEKSQ